MRLAFHERLSEETRHLVPGDGARCLEGGCRQDDEVERGLARGIAVDLTPAAIQRMREDLVFDLAPAQRDFGYAPRPFRPEARMFARA